MNLHKTYYKVYLKDIPTFRKLSNGVGTFFRDILAMRKIKEETKLDYILLSINEKDDAHSWERTFKDKYIEEGDINWDNLIWEEIGWNPDDKEGYIWYENRGYIYKGNLASHLLRKAKLDKLNSL